MGVDGMEIRFNKSRYVMSDLHTGVPLSSEDEMTYVWHHSDLARLRLQASGPSWVSLVPSIAQLAKF